MEKVRPTRLFGNQGEPDLMTDVEMRARSTGNATDKSMPEQSEPERMIMLKSLLSAQTQDINGNITQQGRRIEGVEKVIHENRKETERRFVTMGATLETMEQKHGSATRRRA